MKKTILLLCLGLFLTVSCVKRELESHISNVIFTPCLQNNGEKSGLSGKVNVEFTNKGVQITHYNFEVTCDFTTVDVTHTFVNGVLRITQKSSPNQAVCICYTDVSYTIDGISKKEVNVIFINGVQVYCHNNNENKEGYVTFGANYHVINCMSKVTVFLDGENIGTLQKSVDAILECGEPENLTKKISKGEHTYRIEIRGCCTKDISGTFVVSENECKKIFIDYYQLFANQPSCDQNVIISAKEYENAPNGYVFITGMRIVDGCLKIKFSASGCSGNSWIVKLIDSGTILESNPCQRKLLLSLDNKEMCDAVIDKEISFNIEELQIKGNNKVLLNISGTPILYEY